MGSGGLAHSRYATKSKHTKKTMQLGSRNMSLDSLGIEHKQNQDEIVQDLEEIKFYFNVNLLLLSCFSENKT